MNDRISQQWEVLKRLDAYIGSANTKAGLILSVSTAAATITLASYTSLYEDNSNDWVSILRWLVGSMVILCMLLSIWHSFHTIFPNTTPGSTRSLISFVHISSYEGGAEAYFNAVADENDNDRLKDLCYQSHILGVITTEKFKSIKKSVKALKAGILAGLLLLAMTATSQLHSHFSIENSNKTTSVQTEHGKEA
ncbi:Pycsar system effector family protein [Endozoicomonas sp. 4G]|uniref:Pycsar system effector family protein n=1 Tax=Endozoicomonas sp. 4G TaxID=2872754 RepID=UPI002078607B|nr:Pycsar system effector family protein [Endozoicomonas sp. 4G]